jgi:phosphoglycolate phosphatase
VGGSDVVREERIRALKRSPIVVFDNDGTLIPSHKVANPAIQEGFASFCESNGIDAPVPTDGRICELTGSAGEAFFKALLPDEWKHLYAELRATCLDYETAAMLADGHFYPGIEEMLVSLREGGKRLAIATHAGERYIGAVGKRLGYDTLLDRVYYHGCDGMSSKAEMVRRAIEELGPGDAVFVGDRRADVDAAAEVGVPFIGCLYGYGGAEELEGAVTLAATPAELAQILLGDGLD